MKTHVMLHPRAEELLVDRALRPLDDAEAAELAALAIDDDSLDIAAGSIAVATTRVEAMPDDAMERLVARALAAAPAPASFQRTLAGVLAPTTTTTPTTATRAPQQDAPVVPITRARRRVPVAWVGVAAAAGVAIAIGATAIVRGGGDGDGERKVPVTSRTALLDSGERALAWTATKDATARGASGDVVWSRAQQRGYMRFVGLARNDPKAWQYQLWIFDRTRDQAFPVDGGVFDVSSTGEIIVPIAAKLHVDDATLFAVTIERPGGVVVSKRERIVVTATPG